MKEKEIHIYMIVKFYLDGKMIECWIMHAEFYLCQMLTDRSRAWSGFRQNRS